MDQVRALRTELLARNPSCWICGRSPKRPHRGKPLDCSNLSCHEIACGRHRDKALDKPCAILIACWTCNSEVLTDRHIWPEARQLALLRRRAREDYDLAAYNKLVNPRAPNRITQAEVDHWR